MSSSDAEPAPTDDRSESSLQGVGFDIAWTYVGAAATGAMMLLLPAVAIRRLGPSDYGAFALIVAAAALIAPLDGGLSLVCRRAAAVHLVRPTAENAAQVLAARHWYLAMALLVSLISTVLATLAVVGLVPGGGPMAGLVGCVGLSTCITAYTGAEHGVLQGHREFRTVAVAACAGAVATCASLPLLLDQFALFGLGLAMVSGTVVHRWVVYRGAHRLCPWLSSPRDALDVRAQRRRVAALAGPLVLIGVGGQVVATTDVFVIGAKASAAAVGIYRITSLLPTQVASLLFRGYDTIFPSLAAGAEREQSRASQTLTRLFGLVAGLVFGLLISNRQFVVGALVGSPSESGEQVLALFCLIWGVNVAAHGLALLLIARDRQRIFAPLVLIEAALNLLLSLVLVDHFGAVGAAWATLVTLSVSNLALLPLIARRAVWSGATQIVATGVASIVLGSLISLVAGFVVARLEWSPLALLAASSVVSLTAGLGLSALLFTPCDRHELIGVFRRRGSA